MTAGRSPRLSHHALFGASFALFVLRAWIALDHPLQWLGSLGSPLVIRSNKLLGWLHAGTVLDHWSPRAAIAGLAWEWLPALLFSAGLHLWLRRAKRPPRRDSSHLSDRGYAWAGFAAVLLVAAAISQFSFHGIPHVQDSIAHQFQAQIFAAGRAFAPLPPHPEFFFHEFVVQDHGRWYAQYPPGQSALLAVGELIRLPWLIDPVLGAATGVLLFGAARQAYGSRTARLSLALYCVSPFVCFMSGERMSHAGTLFWISAALRLAAPGLRARPETFSLRRGVLTGLALGLAVSTRSLCGAAAALPVVMGVLFAQAQSHRRQELWKSGAALGAGLLLGVVPALAFNAATTGSPFRSGYEVQWGSSGWGFGQSQWGAPHTPAAGLAHLVANWDAAAKYLFEWPIPSLLPLVGVFLIRRRTWMDTVLVGTLASVSLAYLPYFFQDLALGPRFLYACVPAFTMLSARGLLALGAAWSSRSGTSRPTGVLRMLQAAALCSVVGLAANLPILVRWYSSSFWGTGTAIVDEARRRGVRGAIVFIRDYNRARTVALELNGVPLRVAHAAVEELDARWIDTQIAETAVIPQVRRGPELTRRLQFVLLQQPGPFRRRTVPWIDYMGASSSFMQGFWANTPMPERQDVIYALDLGARNALLAADYPGRSSWLYAPDTTTGAFHLQPIQLTPLTARRAPPDRSRPASGSAGRISRG